MGSFPYLFVVGFCFCAFREAFADDGDGCPSPRLPQHLGIVWTSKPPAANLKYPDGVVIGFACDAGYTLFGSGNTTCLNGKWLEYDTKCFLEIAEGSRCLTSSQTDELVSAQLAADGNPQTCVPFTPNQKRLIWSVDTMQAFRVRAVKILTQVPLPDCTIEIRVGSHHPSTGSKFNTICTRQKLSFPGSNKMEFRCDNDAASGRYVSILIEEPGDRHVSLCEVNVFSDSGLSVDDGCPAESLMIPGTARYIFENQCVQFLGQHTHDNASLLCGLHGGNLVMPTSRQFQSFLDYHVLKFFQTSFDQVTVSFWVGAERTNGSNSWLDGNGTPIEDVEIKADTDGRCLVSEAKSWHSEPCHKQHQVICISPPISCGTPSLPEHSSAQQRSKLSTNESVIFNCEPGFRANLDTISCYSNGSLSEEPFCVALPGSRSLSFSSRIVNFLRSLSIFANLSARMFRMVLALLGGAIAALLSSLLAWCFCLLQRRRPTKKLFQFSLADF